MTHVVRWGILATGRIAGAFTRGVARTPTGKVVAVGSRSEAKAQAFIKEQGIADAKAHGSYEALLADAEVDAVYIATPHPLHARWSIAAAEAGKHILCEKPLAMNQWETQAVIEAAKRCDVFLMEAFMYRCHPQTHKIVELIRGGAIGQVRFISATFGFDAAFNPTGRLFSNDGGGGGILDVGCYPVSMSRLIAGAALGREFVNPSEVSGAGHLGETGVDEWAAATLKFDGGIIAQLRTAARVPLGAEVVVYGSEGQITVPSPWLISKEGGTSQIFVRRKGKDPQTLDIKAEKWLYEIEAETVAAHIAAGDRQAKSPAMSWGDTLGNMQTLDRWRAAIGLTYEMEKAGKSSEPIRGGKLRRRKRVEMTYGRVAGIDKDISRLVMGAQGLTDYRQGAVMLDDFFEAGGTCIDTAYIYGSGKNETMLGQWINARGVRDQAVVITKGAHSPNCFPDKAVSQLRESLDRLKMDYVDLYFLHRDNTDIPVGEFIDALSGEVEAGRIRAFGGSNWTIARLKEANEYAKKHGNRAMAAVSNNFSLAEMVNPVWGGCIASRSDEWIAWLTAQRMPLFPWSSQARGFFVPGRAAPEKRDDAELVKSWYSDANFQRQRRAIELAKKKGCEPINIALAWVMNQKFPVFPLIGPLTLPESCSSLATVNVRLSDEDMKWLDLKA